MIDLPAMVLHTQDRSRIALGRVLAAKASFMAQTFPRPSKRTDMVTRRAPCLAVQSANRVRVWAVCEGPEHGCT